MRLMLCAQATDGQGRPFNPSGQCDPEVYVGATVDTPSHSAALGAPTPVVTATPPRSVQRPQLPLKPCLRSAVSARVASAGVRFYGARAFPARYHGRAFIAEHGSWNRDPPSGVSRLRAFAALPPWLR